MPNTLRLLSFLGSHLKQPAWACLLLAGISATILVSLEHASLLQGLELSTFDRLLATRHTTPIDDRVVIIAETETDIRRFKHPLSDQILADTLLTLEKLGARVIGLDKYRDLPTPPGSEAFDQVLLQYRNIICIFFGDNAQADAVPGPAILGNDPERLGFNDILQDPDGIIRRMSLFDHRGGYAFPLLLTVHYLASEGITPNADSHGALSLNGISLPRIGANFGGYSQIDATGYQLVNEYPGLPGSYRVFTLAELLDGKIPADALRDKIVLIGGMAPSLQDYHLLSGGEWRYGVELHAFIISQLLDTALRQKPPLRDWPDTPEHLWLLVWCLIGAFSGWQRGGLLRLSLLCISECGLLLAATWLLLMQGWWVPLITPLFGWALALASSVLYFSSQERAERRQLMQLFARHVSPQVANRLWEDREQFFSEGGVRPDTLTATVLFTDLSNFTTVAESMEPLVLMRWLNQYMEEMSRIVIDHGGMINKYIGDAIMAVFGAPVKSETEAAIADDAQRAVQCALSFNQRLQELNQQWQAQGLPTITMRTGIHTGPLVAGSFGGSLRMEYTVIGDTVNTASRLESYDKTIAAPDSAQPCRILIGETTQRYLAGQSATEHVGECHLKGKNIALTIYRVIPQSASSSPHQEPIHA